METTRPSIVVVGSSNVDHTLRVPRIPTPGETLTSSSMLTCFGGKGANQAVAAARAGGRVAMIGCVGVDDFGTRYIEALKAEGIDTSGVLRSETTTGSAFIAVDDAGENSIIVNPGANHAITVADLDKHAELIRRADALLLQLECPLPVVRRAAQIAREAGVKVILNPSPLSEAFLADRFEVDVLIVNEGEAETITPNHNLKEAKCRQLIITRGAESTLSITEAGVGEVLPPKVTPVDTVGAGDTFAGAFAVSGDVAFANAAGALATLKAGAQPSIPSRDEILSFIG
ncbi:ribokinase [Prosthecobacter sp.]|uniref:ribokinase n=1 Tax=Prosthecobacter sp. TaxID=1965333 RepID=UPI001DDA6823|nr:ribokinase [Prosthecobacter sp.]MCB1276683.1 ribokinase [Prosthecobacter sp.]